MQRDRAELEHALREVAGVHAAVEVNGDQVVVTGMVHTPEEHLAAIEVVQDLAPGVDLVDNLIVEDVLPESLGGLSLAETEAAGAPGATPGSSDDEALEPGDFTDQETLSDPLAGSGPSGTRAQGGFGEADSIDEGDSIEEGDRVYVPPVDPVRDETGEVLGGFQETSLDDNEAPHSEVLPGPADEGIVEAVLSELHQDAATSHLEIEVSAEQGIVYLDGTVGDLDDAENAAAVAARVPGIVEVRDRLEIAAG